MSGNANATISGGAVTLGVQSTTAGSLVLANTNAGAFPTTIQSSASATAAWTMTLPVTAGTSTYVLSTNGSGVTSWIAQGGAINVQTFTSSGTWTKPSGYSASSRVFVQTWGGGGSGGKAAYATGGGGGGYNEAWLTLSQFGATETATVGAGGAAVTGVTGNVGGNTTLGSLITAYGGAGGVASASFAANNGGGGGGQISAGSGATPGSPILGRFTGGCASFAPPGNGGSGGSGGLNAVDGFAHGGGGGGGPSSAMTGAASVWGGGGGGGYYTSTLNAGAGGASVWGGNGGAAVAASNGVAGTQPGGGGGGTATGTSTGAGGAGKIVVTVFPA